MRTSPGSGLTGIVNKSNERDEFAQENSIQRPRKRRVSVKGAAQAYALPCRALVNADACVSSTARRMNMCGTKLAWPFRE